MFEKRHYEAIAEVLASGEVCDRSSAAKALADMFARDNPRFDRCRFYEAAKPE